MKQLVSRHSKGEDADEELDRIVAASKEKDMDEPDQARNEQIVVGMLCADEATAAD